MEYTHYVRPDFDVIGLARKAGELDDGRILCFLKLHSIKGVDFLVALEEKVLKPMEVVEC
jgi:hypothetical protein